MLSFLLHTLILSEICIPNYFGSGSWKYLFWKEPRGSFVQGLMNSLVNKIKVLNTQMDLIFAHLIFGFGPTSGYGDEEEREK